MRTLFPSLVGALALVTVAACGDSKPPVEQSGVTPNYNAGGVACGVEGAKGECAIELGRFDGVVSCAKGSRTCRGGAWGACEAGLKTSSVYVVPAPAPRTANLDTGNLHGLVISQSPSDCQDNPCNPYCQHFPDQPDAAITGDSATTYLDRNLTLDELPHGNPPDGFLRKGNDDQEICGGCAPGDTSQACQEACQFDSRCKGGGTDGCQSFADGEKDACTGMDVTAPLVCQIPAGAPNNAGQRKLVVCNRGSTDIPANSGVVCWKFPGGSPQFPESDPVSSASNSAGPVDTFNEEIKAGACITHIVDDSVFGNGGTTSVMCNVRQLVTSIGYSPSSTALPTGGVLGSAWFASTAVANATGADDVGGTNATITFSSGTTAAAGPTTGTGSGWTNPTSVGATADGATATIDIGNGRSRTATPSTATSMSGTWVNPDNGRTVDAVSATASIIGAAATSGPHTATGSQVIAPATWNASGTSIANVNGASNAVSASQVIPGNGVYSMWTGFGAALPAGATITGATVTVRWQGTNNKLDGHVEIWSGDGATLVKAATKVAAPTAALTDSVFTFTAADLASLSVADLVAARLVKFVVTNTANSTSYTANVDSISLSVTYAPAAATAKIRLTDFGLNIPAGSTLTSVTVTPRVGTTGTGSTTFTVAALKTNRTVVASSTTATRTNTTALADVPLTVTGLTATDLTDANFALDVSATATSAAGIVAALDGATVQVAFTAPNTSTLSLTGFNLASIIPAGAYIDSMTVKAGWGIDAANNKASFAAVPKLYGSPLVTLNDGAPGTTIPGAGVSTTWNANGSYYAASSFTDANFVVDVSATTTGNGFVGRVDWVTLTVTYTTPSYYGYLYRNNYGLNVPANATNVTLTFQARWSASDPNTQLCINASNGTYTCTTAGATPASLTTFTTGAEAATAATANSLWASVWANHRPGSGASTVTIDYLTVQARYTTSSFDTGVDECNIHNNWTVSKKNPPLYCPSSTTYFDFYNTRVFNGVCPAGTRTRWRLFGWDTSTPNSTRVEFRFRSFEPTMVNGVATCPDQAPAYSDPPAAIATARSTPTDTQVCSLTAPPAGGCPVILTDALGKPPAPIPNSDSQCLQMDAHGYADALGTPVLNSWNVTYDCLPSD